MPEKINPKADIRRIGKYEYANIPLIARSTVAKKLACDLPEKRRDLSNSIPVDLKPAHANIPRNSLFLSGMEFIAR